MTPQIGTIFAVTPQLRNLLITLGANGKTQGNAYFDDFQFFLSK